MASTLLPTHKFEFIITNSLKYFYTFAAKFKQKWAKGNKKNKFWIQKLNLMARDLGQQF